jgi:hypothetical protein
MEMLDSTLLKLDVIVNYIVNWILFCLFGWAF